MNNDWTNLGSSVVKGVAQRGCKGIYTVKIELRIKIENINSEQYFQKHQYIRTKQKKHITGM